MVCLSFNFVIRSSSETKTRTVSDVSVLQVSPPDQKSANRAYCWLDLNKVVPLPLPPPLARLSHWRWRNCKEAGFDCAASGGAEPRALWESKTGSGLWAGTVFPSYSLRSPSVSLCLHVHQEQAHTRQPTTGNLQRQNSRPSPFLEKWAHKRLQLEMFQHLNQFRFMFFFIRLDTLVFSKDLIYIVCVWERLLWQCHVSWFTLFIDDQSLSSQNEGIHHPVKHHDVSIATYELFFRRL